MVRLGISHMVRRREFIAGLAGTAAATTLRQHAALAQQSAIPTIGWLDFGSPESAREAIPAFQQGLAETGYVDGRNVAVEYRWAEFHDDRLPTLAADLVGRHVVVIATTGGPAPALAAKAAAPTLGRGRSGRQPRSAGRQPDGHQHPLHRTGAKAARTAVRAGSEGQGDRTTR